MNKPLLMVEFERALPARFTTAEFLAMCEANAFHDIKVELVDGEILRMSPPLLPHSYYQSQLIILLSSVVTPETGLTVLAETGITLREGTVRACDAAIVRMTDERRMLRADDVVLLIEISDATLPDDLSSKRDDYAKGGVSDYWVVDVNSQVIHTMNRAVDGRYINTALVKFGMPIDVPGAGGAIIID